jgi:hypothetical protein
LPQISDGEQDTNPTTEATAAAAAAAEAAAAELLAAEEAVAAAAAAKAAKKAAKKQRQAAAKAAAEASEATPTADTDSLAASMAACSITDGQEAVAGTASGQQEASSSSSSSRVAPNADTPYRAQGVSSSLPASPPSEGSAAVAVMGQPPNTHVQQSRSITSHQGVGASSSSRSAYIEQRQQQQSWQGAPPHLSPVSGAPPAAAAEMQPLHAAPTARGRPAVLQEAAASSSSGRPGSLLEAPTETAVAWVPVTAPGDTARASMASPTAPATPAALPGVAGLFLQLSERRSTSRAATASPSPPPAGAAAGPAAAGAGGASAISASMQVTHHMGSAGTPARDPGVPPAAAGRQWVMRRAKADKECVVCMAARSCVLQLPCGHLCCCKACMDLLVSKAPECPMCRTEVTEYWVL